MHGMGGNFSFRIRLSARHTTTAMLSVVKLKDTCRCFFRGDEILNGAEKAGFEHVVQINNISEMRRKL